MTTSQITITTDITSQPPFDSLNSDPNFTITSLRALQFFPAICSRSLTHSSSLSLHSTVSHIRFFYLNSSTFDFAHSLISKRLIYKISSFSPCRIAYVIRLVASFSSSLNDILGPGRMDLSKVRWDGLLRDSMARF